MAGMESIYSATYSNVPVYEFKIDGDSIMRRRADDWVNATHILKAAGFDKPARTRILEREVQRGLHEKVQGGYGKYQGTWIPLPEGRMLAERNKVLPKLAPIFDYVAGDRSPPPAPKHSSASSKPRAPRKSAASRNNNTNNNTSNNNNNNNSNSNNNAASDSFSVIQPTPRSRNMPPPTIPHPHEQYDMSATFDDNASIEQAHLESSSMIGDEDMHASQYGARKRKRSMNQEPTMSITEQEHIIYGDQLLDYFVATGDALQAKRQPPPQPPANFQVDRPIDDHGNTALHWACSMGDLEIVQDLLRRGANPKIVSAHDETPLVRAALFTNNYDKKTFPALFDLLFDTVTYLDWFKATVFHHIAETTKSKGKWKSAKYYCEVILETLRTRASPEDLDILLSLEDERGDTATLKAARNGAFRLARLLIEYCPRTADMVNEHGETAAALLEKAQENEPPAPSSATMPLDPFNGQPSNHGLPEGHSSWASYFQSILTPELAAQLDAKMVEAEKQLLNLGPSASGTPNKELGDVRNPERLFAQIEADRNKIMKDRISASKAKPTENFDGLEYRLDNYRSNLENQIEQNQFSHFSGRMFAMLTGYQGSVDEVEASEPKWLADLEYAAQFNLMASKYSVQDTRELAATEFNELSGNAGVSNRFEAHRQLVSLATGLNADELDPIADELADALEFERKNAKDASPELGDQQTVSQLAPQPPNDATPMEM